MNASQLFKVAHEMTRKVRRPGDDYRVTFAACLRAIRQYVGTVEAPDYCEITLANGEVVRPSFTCVLNDALFARIKAGNKQVGRPAPVSYRNVTKTVPAPMPTVSELLSDWAHAQHAAHHAQVQNAMTLGGRSL